MVSSKSAATLNNSANIDKDNRLHMTKLEKLEDVSVLAELLQASK